VVRTARDLFRYLLDDGCYQADSPLIPLLIECGALPA